MNRFDKTLPGRSGASGMSYANITPEDDMANE